MAQRLQSIDCFLKLITSIESPSQFLIQQYLLIFKQLFSSETFNENSSLLLEFFSGCPTALHHLFSWLKQRGVAKLQSQNPLVQMHIFQLENQTQKLPQIAKNVEKYDKSTRNVLINWLSKIYKNCPKEVSKVLMKLIKCHGDQIQFMVDCLFLCLNICPHTEFDESFLQDLATIIKL